VVSVFAVAGQAAGIVLRRPVLWALGLLTALFLSQIDAGILAQVGSPAGRGVVSTPPIWTWVCFTLALRFGMQLIGVAFRAATIGAGDMARQGKAARFRAVWDSARAVWGQLIVVEILFGGAALLLGLALDALGTPDGGAAVRALAQPIVLLASCAIVLDEADTMEAIGAGWRLYRAHLLPALALSIVLVGVDEGARFAAARALDPLWGWLDRPLAEALAAPEDAALTRLSALVGGVVWLVEGLVVALPTAWATVCWALFYRRATMAAERNPALVDDHLFVR
jgi:hypothetical protein